MLVAPSPGASQDGLGFRLDLGHQELGRDWGDALSGGVDTEVTLLYGQGRFRAGAGVNWASLRETGVRDASWHHLTGILLVGYRHPLGPRVRAFQELRYLRRMARPEGSRLFEDGVPTEPIGPFRATGNGIGAVLGSEVDLAAVTALTLSAGYQWFQTGPDPVDEGVERSGTAWRLAAGLTWFPKRPAPGASGPHPPGEANAGLAVGVGVLGLLLPWTYNEYIKGKPFTAVSPRSWVRGVGYGFGWDDNRFDVNYFRHPYHGQLFFNGARAAGFGFWESALQALVGSYVWECCLETHGPSFSDMVTTVLGGVMLGESVRRVSSGVLDDSAVGAERVLREVAAGIVDPARGISRVASGSAWSRPPTSSVGRRAGGLAPLRLQWGARATDPAGPTAWRSRPFLGLEWAEGDLFGQDNGLFSYHHLKLGLYARDRSVVGLVTLRGTIWQSGSSRGDVPRDEGPVSRFSAFLDLDYIDTEAYRFATNGVSGAWALRLPIGERTSVTVETGASLVVLGSVDSPNARFAEIRGVRERARLYDFGAGGGVRLAVFLNTAGRRGIGISYRAIALETLNGSNIEGSRSWHVARLMEARAHQELFDGWSLGLDVDLFLQDSHYGFAEFTDTSVRVPEARLYVGWAPR